MYTTQDYIDSLYNDRANIVKNLNEKGVEASADETFTQLAPKILNISTGGGEGIYLKNTVEEMEGIENPKENDICLVYTKEQIHPLETSKFAKAIIRHTVTFEANEPGMSEFSSEDFNERLSVRVGTNYASVSYMTRDGHQDYSYDTSDGLTFTLNDYTEDVVLEFNSPLSNMMEYNASSAELLWIDDIDFSGLYEYKEGEWNYLDIDIKTDAANIFSPNKAYTSEGIVEGTTDPKTMYKIPIYIQADEPTDKSGIWIKPSYDYVSYARGKKVIMFTNEDVGPESNKAVQISTLPEDIRRNYANEGNVIEFNAGIFGHTYYSFGKTTDESFTIDLLTGEKTNIPVCPYLQNLQSNSKRKVTQMCMDEVRNAIYLIAHDDLSWPLLACDYVLYKYDTETQTYEDKTSVLNIKERGYSANISWIHNNEMRIFVEVADRESECRIYNLPDLTLKEVIEQKGNKHLSTFRWIDNETIQDQSGVVINAYTGEVISEVDGSYDAKVWIPALEQWGITSGSGMSWSGCVGFYGEDFKSVIRYALNFYLSDGTPAIGSLPTCVIPLEDKILLVPVKKSGSIEFTNNVFAIAYEDIKPIPTLDFNENTVITLQMAPTSFQEPYDWTDKGLDALALNIKNAFLYNENYYDGTPGANAAKYVYLGNGTNWNLIASNIYTEEA